ncbi:tRNA-splicing endonuclease subunit sen54 [Polyrhizophydium stewartii]|uniref:tRNA-splicing endonuclease subunit sen54 n=1 Tax=Polyrhizophydium stewartii TaxID=2732419 RepID=A0ABR4MZL9_9FUNG
MSGSESDASNPVAASDSDDQQDRPDFRALLRGGRKPTGPRAAAVPADSQARGHQDGDSEDDSEDDCDRDMRRLLPSQLAAMQQVLSQERRTARHMAAADWIEPDGAAPFAVVAALRGQHLTSVGRTTVSATAPQGETRLHAEEVLWLVDQSALVLSWRGGVVSFQQAVSLATSGAHGGAITLGTYLVYAHLKRLGFLVFRSCDRPAQHDAIESLPGPQAVAARPRSLLERMADWLAVRLRDPFEPLVDLSAASSHDGVLVQLRSIVKSHDPLGQLPAAVTSRTLPPFPALPLLDVYKPSAGFKKSARGPPDFRVLCTV